MRAPDGEHSWREIGERVGLSTSQARRVGLEAAAKLVAALEREGITREYLVQIAIERLRKYPTR